MKYLLSILFFFLQLTYAVQTEEKHTINIGILSLRDIDENQKAWKPLEDYLNNQNQAYQYKIFSYNEDDLENAVAKNQLDILLAHSRFSVMVEAKYNTHNIATIVRKDQDGNLLNKYGSVIIVMSNRDDINNLNDLKNKKIAIRNKKGFASYLIVKDMLDENGINIEKDCELIYNGQSVEDLWEALKTKKADVAIFRTGYIEELVKKGKLNANDIKVINPQKVEGFNYILSSRLYPEWAVIATTKATLEETKMISLALYTIKESNCSEFDSFTPPSSYMKTRELMKKLQIYPFDNVNFSFSRFLEEYEYELEFTILILLFGSWAFTYYYIRSSRKIKEDAKQLNTILKTASDGIHVHDKNGKLLFFSDSFHNMLGYTREEMSKLTVFDFEKNLNSEQVAAVIDDVITNNKILRFEAKHQKKDGSILEIELLINAITLNNKHYIYAVSRDITEQKELENQLLKAQEIGHFGSYEFDLNSNSWSSSKELNRIFGIDEHYQKTAQSWLDIVHDDFTDEMREYLYVNILTNKEFFNKVYKIKHQVTGEDRWVHGQGTIEFDSDNNISKVFGVIQDITLQKEHELLIIEKKEEFETIFNNSKDGIAVFDLNSKFLDFNPAYLEMTGYTKEELLTKTSLELTVKEDRWKSEKAFEAVLINGYVENFEKSYLVKDDKIIVVNITLSLMPDKQRIIAFTKNVTQNKLFESQAKLASMGEMIGNIAHQWRQPLSLISTLASGISFKKEFGSLKEDEIIPSMEHIVKQTEYLSKTIDDFRNFIKGGNIEEQLNISSLFDRTSSIVGPSLKSNYIQLIQNIDPFLQIKGYGNELIQTFINIINNSKDALITDGNIEDKYIFIDAKKIDNRCEIIIKDNGGGIMTSVIDRIFEPYFTTKHQSQGTGLGLSMSYKIITELHQGTITASNTTYKYNEKEYTGACFMIVL